MLTYYTIIAFLFKSRKNNNNLSKAKRDKRMKDNAKKRIAAQYKRIASR